MPKGGSRDAFFCSIWGWNDQTDFGVLDYSISLIFFVFYEILLVRCLISVDYLIEKRISTSKIWKVKRSLILGWIKIDAKLTKAYKMDKIFNPIMSQGQIQPMIKSFFTSILFKQFFFGFGGAVFWRDLSFGFVYEWSLFSSGDNVKIRFCKDWFGHKVFVH